MIEGASATSLVAVPMPQKISAVVIGMRLLFQTEHYASTHKIVDKINSQSLEYYERCGFRSVAGRAAL